MWANNSMKRFSDTLTFSGDMWRYVLTMYNIFGTGRDIKKYLHRTVDPSKLFMYSDFPISMLCTLY